MDKMREEVRKAFYDGYDLGDTHRYNESTGGISMEAAEQQRWESRQSALQPSAWTSCAERLPTEGTYIVCTNRRQVMEATLSTDQAGRGVWIHDCGSMLMSDVSHWMELPQPPEEK